MAVSFDRVRALLDYDPETGLFRWKKRPARTPKERTWNTRFAGTVAGTKSEALGYVLISIDGTREYAHRLAWLWMTGCWPVAQIDHANMVRDDNRWSNLRSATKAQNMHNTAKLSTNKSGFKGVYWHKQRKKWHAQIRTIHGKLSLGLHETREEAAAAYEAAARELRGAFAR